MRNIKIGIIGSGGMAQHHLARLSSLEKVRVVAISSRNEQTGKQLATEATASYIPDWEFLINQDDIDAVVICTHNDSHGEMAIAALQANKHVFVEYPLANSVDEGEMALHLANTRQRALRVSHPEVVSNTHKALKHKTSDLGELLLTSFVRLTPGRGARPEILFNLPVSGIPAHFFIYHIYPIVDLFGEAKWVQGGARYAGLTDTGQYDHFVNSVTVAFKQGGIGQWSWAGGIAINTAEQHERYVLTEGTLSDDGNGWTCSTPTGVTDLVIPKAPQSSIQELWISEIHNSDQSGPCLADAEVALSAIRISLASAQSIQENRQVEV